MRDKKSIQGVRDSYRRRQQMAPFIVGGIAVVFLVVGGLFLALTVADGGVSINLFASKTPAPTETFTPSMTPTITDTPTLTPTLAPSETWTPSPTATISGPFTYRVEEGDTLYGIAEKFGVELLYLMSYNNLRDGNIFVGEEIIIPPRDVEPPTTTPLPTYLPKGRVIEIVVVPNDSLHGLASKYNSTVEAILKENEDILDPNNPIVYVGQVLKIPVNLVTPTKTITPQLSERQTQTQIALQGTPTP